MHSHELISSCEERLGASLDLLQEMVAINSFTENPAGVNRLGELIAARFAPLGFEASFHHAANPAHGRHLVLRRSSAPGAPTIALVSHLDTVFTEEEEQRNAFHWRREGSRIHGPGTNDIKGGSAMIHLMLATFADRFPDVFASVNWTVLHNACEEVISTDFGRLCREQLPADTLACLIFEVDGGGLDDFSLVSARKGRATFSVEVEGRGAHAGGSHHRGANAIVQLAELATKLSQLTSYKDELTVNIGSISGGTVINRVPHHAMMELEMRAFSPEAYARAKSAILGCTGRGTVRSADEAAVSCHITARLVDETAPWPRNPGSDALLDVWQEAGRELGLDVRSQARGGLSDGNVLWDFCPTLDGLGPRGDNCHCSERSADGSKEQEWADASSFAPKAALNLRAIIRLLEGAGVPARHGFTPRA